MKFSTKLLMTALLGVATSAMAQDPVTISVAYDTGTLKNAQSNTVGNWNRYWTSTATNPQLVIDFYANNVAKGTSGAMNIYVGTAANPNPFSFSFDEGWYVSNISADVSTAASGMTVVTNSGTTSLTSEAQHISQDLRYGTDPILKIGGSNSAITFANFTVTLSPITEELQPDPVLSLDEAPAADPDCSFAVTNITDGKYNDFTTWYHLQEGVNIPGFADADLYCFVKEGSTYAIYNKATGITAYTYADGKVFDGTKELTVVFAQKLCPVGTAFGKMYRDTSDYTSTNAWRNNWVSNYTAPTVRFYGATNCMSTTASSGTFTDSGNIKIETGSNGAQGNYTWNLASADGNYVYAYTFLAKKESDFSESSTITAGGNAYSLRTIEMRIEGTNAEDLAATTFTQTAINGKGAILSDFYVTVRRITSHHNTLTGTYLFPRNNGPERRIPAIATVGGGQNAGRVIAVYDLRQHGGDIGGGNIGLQMCLSDDNGATWTAAAYGVDANGTEVTKWNPAHTKEALGMATMQADPNTYWDCAFGDAAIVGDRESGRVLLMSCAGPTNFFAGRRANPNQCARWYSEDGGQTWSEPEQVTEQILSLFDGEPVYGQIDSQFIGSGKIMQSRYVKVGDYYRLYAVLSSQNNGGNTRNWVLYSDDFGMTWAILGGWDKSPVPSVADEPKAEELPDGSVLLAARGQGGGRNFNIFRYTDVEKGEGKWFDHVNTNMGLPHTINACDGEIMILPVVNNETQEKHYLALQSFPYGPGRNYVSIAFKALKSAEDFATPSAFTIWDGLFRVDNGPSVYSTMTWQKNNTIGFLYEAYNCDGVYFNFTLEYITNGLYSYVEDTDNAIANSLRDDLVSFRADAHPEAGEIEGYVGQELDPTAFFAAVDAYRAAPSYDEYVKVNVAEYLPEVIVPVSGGIYRFISAHHGQYSGTRNNVDYNADVFLSTDGNTLIPSNDEDDTCALFKVDQTEEGTWTLYNDEAEMYIGNAPASYQKYVMEEDPAEFVLRYSTEGHTSLDCVNKNASGHGGIHLDANGQIVTWAYTSQASLWHMQRMDKPQDSISEVVAAEAAEAWFDLQGRRVANPTRGLYISTSGRKTLK